MRLVSNTQIHSVNWAGVNSFPAKFSCAGSVGKPRQLLSFAELKSIFVEEIRKTRSKVSEASLV